MSCPPPQPPWPIYPKYACGWWWERLGAVGGFLLILYTAWTAYFAPPCTQPDKLMLLAALWGVLPSLFWWVEFFYMYPPHHTTAKFELLKHAAQASLAIWAPIAVALAAYASSDYFKPVESPKTCLYVQR